MKAIPTRQDVLEAWALMFRWNGGEKRLKADFHLVKAWYPMIDGLCPDTPGMADTLDALRAKGEGRSGWGYFLAIMLLVTRTRRDEGAYWRVASGLMDAARQVTRISRHPRAGDPLSAWLKGYCEEHPSATSAEIYADVMRMCGPDEDFEVREGGGITFKPKDPDEPLIDVDGEALKKRIRRIQTSTG